MKDPICWPNSPFREVFCILGAQDKTLPGNFHRLVEPWNYYLLSFFCMCQQSHNEKPKGHQRVFRVVGRLLKALGGEVLLSSILPVVENDIKRKHVEAVHPYLALRMVSLAKFCAFGPRSGLYNTCLCQKDSPVSVEKNNFYLVSSGSFRQDRSKEHHCIIP